MTEQEFAELAAGYALNALSPDDRDAFEAAFAVHPEWSVHVDADAATAAALAATVADVAPPLTMRSTLLAQIATTAQGDAPASVAADPEPVERTPDPSTAPPTTTTLQAVSRRNWTRSLLALAASLIVLVTLGFGAASLGQWLGRSEADIALQQIEDSPDAQSATGTVSDGGTATAHWSESLGKAVLVSDGLPTITTGETFELWFVREDGTPVSAGTFAASSGGETTALLSGEMEAGDTIAVTVEDAGGSPDGTPTSDPIVAIPTV